jgi:hypothetical protein
MIQRAIDRYSNFYEQRSASRERSQKSVKNKENSYTGNQGYKSQPNQELSADKLVKSLKKQESKAQKPSEVEESLGLRDPV